jgi:hypothetical protein
MDHDREIHEGIDLGEARDAVASAADGCAAACLEGMGKVGGPAASILQSLAGVASVAAERPG